MHLRIGKSTIEVVKGDITDEDTDIIVNAASRSLQGGGGVDEAIHEVGGREILEECREIGWCGTGDAKITGAGNLNAKYVVHAVGPVYLGEGHGEPELLVGAYRRSFELAVEYNAESISFPSISTGAHAYPAEEAAEIALQTAAEFLEAHQDIRLVRFVLFEEHVYRAFLDAIRSMARSGY